jgi:surface polysaccharide O-acyltransferase-like enzyme
MDRTTRLSYLDALRGFAILFVVGGHAAGYTFTDGDDGFGSFRKIWLSVSGAAVPIFFVVDGLLTARSQDRLAPPKLSDVVRKSVRRLLIPWAIFTIIYVAMRAVFEVRGLFKTQLVVGQPLEVVLANIFHSQIAMQLYFLPALFLIRVLAVPLARLARQPIAVFLALWIGYFALIRVAGVRLGGDPISNAVIGFQYFLFGMMVYRIERSESRRWANLLGLLAVVAIAQDYVDLRGISNPYSYDIAKYGVIIAAYLIAKWTSGDWSPLAWIGRRTMQIYLLHAPVLMKVVLIVAVKLTASKPATFALVWTLTIVIPLLIAIVLERFPRSKWLFGEA